MYEKVNPCHPDKCADRIAGAIVDMAYRQNDFPKIAVEILLGHGTCHIIVESSESIRREEVAQAVFRITHDYKTTQEMILVNVPQDVHLAGNQKDAVRCGDNGIFKGMPVTVEQRELAGIARDIYSAFQSDGKYVLDMDARRLIVCQSNANEDELWRMVRSYGFEDMQVNPLGPWTGGPNVDSGATNRKLGSDMGDAVTGGGLWGKDLSKADVSVNIYAHLKAQRTGKPIELCCAIGDEYIDGKPYSEIVEIARQYIQSCGGFERAAEWGLI